MDDNLTKWQSIWQEQKSKPMQLNKLISRLNVTEQKAKNQRIILLLLFVILTVVSIVQLSEILAEKYYLIAYIFTLLSIGVKLIPSLIGKYNFITNEAEFSNRKFIKKLKEKMTFDTNYLLTFLLLAILGLNFALLGLYEKRTIFNFAFTPKIRVILHLSTILLFIAGYTIHKKRVLQPKNEISDFIIKMENMN